MVGLERLKADVRKWFSRGEFRPARHMFMGNKECCALTAAYLLDCLPYWEPRHVVGVNVVDYVQTHYGLDRNYVIGFMAGWDTYLPNCKAIAAVEGTPFAHGFDAGYEFSREFFPDKPIPKS